MHLFVLGCGDEARSRFGLVDRSLAVDFGAARLRLGSRPHRLRGTLGVVEATAVAVDGMRVVASEQLRVQHRRRRAHALAPFRIWAIWMNLIGTPMRSAQPC